MKLFSRYRSKEAVDALVLAINAVSKDDALETATRKACLGELHRMRKAFKKRKEIIII